MSSIILKRNTFHLRTKSFKAGPTNNSNNYRTVYTHSRLFFFQFPLCKEMKRSFMLFPLVALFITVWRFISWFHLRFFSLVLGKPLKCVSDSKQSFACFLSLSPVTASLMCIKKKKKDFQSGWATLWSQDPFSTVLRNRDVVIVSWLTWKKRRSSFFVISLISIISPVWMNFRWLAGSYLCCQQNNMYCLLHTY